MVRRAALTAAGALLPGILAVPASAQVAAVSPAAGDPLLAGFRQPPDAAHPRVWWHWMNGNVTWDGVRKDMEWMKRVGIAGLQAFDAGMATPQVVDVRLPYMTPGWKQCPAAPPGMPTGWASNSAPPRRRDGARRAGRGWPRPTR